MTTPEQPARLKTLYDASTGLPTTPAPVRVEISQDDLSAHPFIWALDSLMFAGPDAHRATLDYAEQRNIGRLEVDVFKIVETVPSEGRGNVMHLYRVV